MHNKMNIENLKTKGFVSISYPTNLRKAVKKTVVSWKEFCDLPKEVKTKLPYSNSADGVGYEFKDGSGVKGDYKENFDITLSGKNWLDENNGKIDNLATSFITNALDLVELSEPLILDFAKKVEDVFGITGFYEEVKESRDNFFFRFIHYFPNGEAGEETATSHVDQSGFTLHLFESAKGLECLTFDNNWAPMPVGDDETIIIGSMQLQLRSEGRIKALAHRVISNEITKDVGRYSAVCFVQLKNTPKYNKEKWGRLQEKEPGFNYKMDNIEFSKFFK